MGIGKCNVCGMAQSPIPVKASPSEEQNQTEDRTVGLK